MRDSILFRNAFLISLIGHSLFLGVPEKDIFLRENKDVQDMAVMLDIKDEYSLLPEINKMGEKNG